MTTLFASSEKKSAVVRSQQSGKGVALQAKSMPKCEYGSDRTSQQGKINISEVSELQEIPEELNCSVDYRKMKDSDLKERRNAITKILKRIVSTNDKILLELQQVEIDKELKIREKHSFFTSFNDLSDKLFKDEWEKTVSKHSELVDKTVESYNKKLFPNPPLDPNWIKAMIFVETWGSPEANEYDPMQIANNNDDGLEEIQKESEKVPLIISDNLRDRIGEKEPTPRRNGKWDYSALTPENRMDSSTSIEGGIVWLLNKAAKRNLVDTYSEYEYTVRKGDRMLRVLKKHKQDYYKVKKLNPNKDFNILKPGDKFKFLKKEEKWAITGWRSWKKATIRYNSRRIYYEKVKLVFDRINTIK